MIGYNAIDVLKLRKHALKYFKYFVTFTILCSLITHIVFAISSNIGSYASEQVLTTLYVSTLSSGNLDGAEEIRVLMKENGVNNKLFDEIIPNEKITSKEMYIDHINDVAKSYGSYEDLNLDFVTDVISENVFIINIMSLVGSILQLINIILRFIFLLLMFDLFRNYIKIVKTGFSEIFMIFLFTVSFFMSLNALIIVILTLYLMINKLCKRVEFK